jgi:hypothetical protein
MLQEVVRGHKFKHLIRERNRFDRQVGLADRRSQPFHHIHAIDFVGIERIAHRHGRAAADIE